MNNRIKRSRLSVQFVLLIAGILVLSMGLNIAYQYYTQLKMNEESLEVRGQSLGELLATFSIEALLINDIVALNDYAENTSNQDDVDFVLISEINDEVILSYARDPVISSKLKQIKKINQETFKSFLSSNKTAVFKSDVVFVEDELAKVYIGLDKASYQQRLEDHMLPNVVLILLTSLFVGAGVFLVFERKVLGQIVKLRDGAHRISELNFAEKINIKTNNEISDLADSFNYMSLQLEENIEARDQVMQQLEVVNDSLEERIKQRTSEMESLAATMAHQAMHDPLTALPNRVLVVERLQAAISIARRKNARSAFFILDLNNFKDVNDTMGHPAGDEILKQVAARLPNSVREVDTIGRLGGDEFAVVLPETDNEQAVVVANKIIECLDESFTLDGQNLSIAASIGIAIYPDHGDDQDALIRHADVAMYEAKRSDQHIAFYDPESDKYTQYRLTLMADLRKAVENDQLVLYYQPQVNLKTNRVESVEALVRWQHPEQNLVMPDLFVPIAENSGIINILTEWVLKEASRQWRSWTDQGINLRISINLSVKNLANENLPEYLENLCRQFSITPEAIKLEITESAIMSNPERILELMSRTGLSNFQYAIDDFGTGYSSLSYLKKLRVNEVKIDKSFVMDMETNEEDTTIVRSVIDLTHNLGHIVVAEGVENEKVLKQLITLDCDYGQGYFFSRPVPAENIFEVINDIENKPLI